jgi:endo-1,4-beta-xylanase
MPVKIARSAPRPSFGLPELLVAIHTPRQSCGKAGKARIFALVWESSGESRVIKKGRKNMRTYLSAGNWAMALVILSSWLPGSATAGLRDQPYVTSGRVFIGSAAEYEFSYTDPNYLPTLAREYNILTTNWSAIMRTIQPDAASAFSSNAGWDFSFADAMVAFAQQNGMVVRGHNLVGGSQYNPPWFNSGGYSPSDLYQIMRNRITTEMIHFESNFPGVVQYWDVVNEGVTDGCGNIWVPVGGPDYEDPCLSYIFTAYQIARDVANSINPGIKLVYNENGAEGTYENCSTDWWSSSKVCQVYRLVRALKSQGLVDAVGLQMHGGWPDSGPIRNNIRQLGQLGLEVQITELDYGLSSPTPSESELQKQASIYAVVANACLAEPNCSAILTWEFQDSHSWLIRSGSYAPLPFDTTYNPKPAYFALEKALSGAAWAVQLVGDRLESNALVRYNQLQKKYQAILGGREPMIVRTMLGSAAIWHRIRIAAETREGAEALCSRLRAAGETCLVLRN